MAGSVGLSIYRVYVYVGGWDGVCVCESRTQSIWPLRLSSGAPGVSVAWNPVCMFVCHLASERHNPSPVVEFVHATTLAIDQTCLFFISYTGYEADKQ